MYLIRLFKDIFRLNQLSYLKNIFPGTRASTYS
jgi:hypothetical protein